MLRNSSDLVPAGVYEHVTACVLRFAARALVKPTLSANLSVPWQRFLLKQALRMTQTARGVRLGPGTVGGIKGEWVHPPAAKAGVILYFHGGGYCVGAPKQHRAITSHLARASGLPVFASLYRLAPEHPFPVAIDDAVAAYEALRAHGSVILAGDSAGAGLALVTALMAREQSLGAPAALLLFAPWVDLTLSAISKSQPDPVLSADWLAACARHYLGGTAAASPLASPLFAELHGLPSVLIQAGADDLLHSDATRLHDALAHAGVDVTCEIIPSRWHVFQLNAGVLPSATAALARAGAFAIAHHV